MITNLIIRKSNSADLEGLLAVERAAFGSEEEAELVRSLLDDSTAEPTLSLLALSEGQPVGHIIFTGAVLDPPLSVQGMILGPLAVIPSHQKEGIGGSLIQEGLEILRNRGVGWVFVLGHESYYPRFGFTPALKLGFEPPYPIPGEFTNAWMAMALTPNPIATYKGMVIPCDTFNHPRYWGE